MAQDTSTITACANDFGYEVLFERMVETIGNQGDVIIGITTSGKSENVNLALVAAKKNRIKAFGFLGCGGGDSAFLCDQSLNLFRVKIPVGFKRVILLLVMHLWNILKTT